MSDILRNVMAERALLKARSQLVRGQVFYGCLAMRMTYAMDHTIETMATDGERVMYNPAFVLSLSEPELQGVLAHEVTHVALQHHTRRGNREAKRWNVSCDYVVNGILDAAKFTLPKGALRDPQYDGKLAEEIYRLLGGEKRAGGPSGGGAAGGGTDPGKCGAVMDAPGGQAGKAAAAAKAATMVLQATQAARSMGDSSGDIEEMAKACREPVLPWQDLLRDYMTRAARNDHSWSRPNRRYAPLGVFLPSLLSNVMGDVVIGVDTSESVSLPWLQAGAVEVRCILEDLRPGRVDVVYCDTRVGRVDTYEGDEVSEFELHCVGRGGTDFRPVFAEVEERGLVPAVLIYFTDGECDRFGDEPGYPVIWCQYGSGGAVPWGDVVRLRD